MSRNCALLLRPVERLLSALLHGGHRWWPAGPSPEIYVGFILGLATFPAARVDEKASP
ncbi:MAG TPA: hypothetical protein PK490_18560 [Prosthecobacter sp.]|nr:hypothetical protein [Prosthecobacter sp.]HRK16290.1 hypothetical protein [Prosthecobacter sp.]